MGIAEGLALTTALSGCSAWDPIHRAEVVTEQLVPASVSDGSSQVVTTAVCYSWSV